MTTETELMNQALERDLVRYRRAADDRERLMIMDRMIDTMCDLDPELDLADAQSRVRRMIKADKIIDGLIRERS